MSSLPEPVECGHEEADTQAPQPVAGSKSGLSDEEAGFEEQIRSKLPAMPLPEIPAPNLDLELDMTSILGTSSNAEVAKVQKRASKVLKLSQENEKLKAELEAMTARLEAAERRREELARRQQMVMDMPSS
ncbi:hypothetical protein C0991_008226 [Blastosporella zonata]|nr:hypothetical protein C0991_008226 [Blastosporella zonata]